MLNEIKNAKMRGKKVFVRCDFNVPMNGNKIVDDYRIRNALPTIELCLKKGAKQIVLASHLGRPKGWDETLSMKNVGKRLSTILKQKVYLHDSFDREIPCDKKIVLLENLRFMEGEKKGSLAFAKKLSKFAEIYVDDAFGTAHRKDASVYAIAKLLPSYAGLLVGKEIKNVSLEYQEMPVVSIFGAAKIHDKLPLFKKLLIRVDKVLIGGGVVFTFLQAAGIEIGKSLVEEDMIDDAKQLLKRYGDKIILPVDFVGCTPSKLKTFEKLKVNERKAFIKTYDIESIPKSIACYDIGPQSIKLFAAALKGAKTVVWNGPVGLDEIKPFDNATNQLVKIIAEMKVKSIICGGDTASAVRKTKYKNSITHISTGGGASLQLLSGKKLPAIEVLNK